ncbi:SDR family NAD(P)-dependent oxidoreductase [Aspergillus aculeatinus CBS 121060]|uniref:NAD(P)-binding protein n=1 Tax=Aspergillus aculeatinus CBS 121060 TaxID=1448322 RepID=A0ACD1H6W2_9EURO|nr:NAD(P)-binding protein [Aspergillus aculeatinus CBS 121060]RAH69141.1 NAD(P)-binding protein [Aspergillus aculeatinus CBS 121060]
MTTTPRLANKIAIVTGSSSGLGRAISLRYAREGAKLICADLTPTARAQVPSETSIATHDLIVQGGGEAVFVKTDVGDAGDMERVVQTAVDVFGRLDILVNNAGVALEARTPAVCHLTEEEVWDTTMRVNSKSVFLGCKYATAQMLKQEPHQPSGDRGWIINMSSIMGIVAGLDNVSYCASKGAVSNLTKQVALDYAPHRIHVNALCPGYTQTAIFQETTAYMTPLEDLQKRHPFKGPGMPDDIARMAVVLASEDANWVTGILLPVDGGYTAR